MNHASEVAAADRPAGAAPSAPGAARAAAPAPPAQRPSDHGRWRWVGAVAAAALLVAGASAWWSNDRASRLERDFARRLQQVEATAQQREEQLRLLGDSLRDAQAKLALTEAKLADSLGQQLQLRQLYDEMARNRGELLLADVENSIMIAAQQLQLAGNVRSALLALQDAEQLVARSSPPALVNLRRVLARDIERLKGLPLADYAAAIARLDAVIAAVDQLPLLSDVGSVPDTDAGVAVEPRPGLLGLSDRVARTGVQGWDAFVAELRGLFRVQRVDQPEAVLLSPEQRFFARENLRLQLLQARSNLLARNEPLFRGDLTRALKIVERWFDPQHRAVASAVASLRQLHSAAVALELPSLADSIAAVRAARTGSESR